MPVLRLARLVRVFRVLKMPKLRTCVTMFVHVLQEQAAALQLCGACLRVDVAAA